MMDTGPCFHFHVRLPFARGSPPAFAGSQRRLRICEQVRSNEGFGGRGTIGSPRIRHRPGINGLGLDPMTGSAVMVPPNALRRPSFGSLSRSLETGPVVMLPSGPLPKPLFRSLSYFHVTGPVVRL